jgi:hypothetical protein
VQEENTGKPEPGWLLSVGAPAFMRGSSAFNPSGRLGLFTSGFSRGVFEAGAKALSDRILYGTAEPVPFVRVSFSAACKARLIEVRLFPRR